MVLLKKILKRIVSTFGYEVKRKEDRILKNYLHPRDIVEAEALNLSLWDYLERDEPKPTTSRIVAERLILPYLTKDSTVLEIGAGAGRMTSKIFEVFPGIRYLSYEHSDFLNQYLQQQFGQSFRVMPTNGYELAGTADNGVDFVLAYGVFTYVESFVIVRYLNEASRVLRRGGHFLFDIFDTDHFSVALEQLIEKKSSNCESRPYMSGKFFENLLRPKNLALKESFQDQRGGGYSSRFLLFRKTEP